MQPPTDREVSVSLISTDAVTLQHKDLLDKALTQLDKEQPSFAVIIGDHRQLLIAVRPEQLRRDRSEPLSRVVSELQKDQRGLSYIMAAPELRLDHVALKVAQKLRELPDVVGIAVPLGPEKYGVVDRETVFDAYLMTHLSGMNRLTSQKVLPRQFDFECKEDHERAIILTRPDFDSPTLEGLPFPPLCSKGHRMD